MSVHLSSNTYGKTKVRVAKIFRRDATHHNFVEMNVQCLLTGAFAESYTKGDNSRVIPTDTVKNTIYVLAKTLNWTTIEEFGVALGRHFLAEYNWVESVAVDISSPHWVRMVVGNPPSQHSHSFVKTLETRTTSVRVPRRGSVTIESGVEGLQVLKTTNSGFENYHKDKYTTLQETRDRILATSVTCRWKYNTTQADFDAIWYSVRQIILDCFALNYSRAVQEDVYRMGKTIIEKHGEVDSVWFSLPNMHYWQVDLSPFGVTDKPTSIFKPLTDPSGLIQGTISRNQSKL